VLFTADAWPGLASGDITVTFRTWTRPQVKVGGRYQAGGSTLLVDDVRQVRVADISDDDARRAGEDDRGALLVRLAKRPRGRYTARPSSDVRPEITDDTLVWRVEFHAVAPDAPPLAEQDDLTSDDVAEITRRLDRLDAASSHGPWTRQTLQLIADRPAVVSTTLAEVVGRERQDFKVDVRKLKRLGLTESLDVGYRISPRGKAYLAAASDPGADRPDPPR
jgi:hypothetical protein